MTSAATFLFHAIILGINGYSNYYARLNIRLESDFSFGGKWKFLTFLNFFCSTLYFALSFVCDFIGDRKPELKKLRSVIFSVLFPMSLFVTISFWGIYAVDRNLIYPPFLDKIIPTWYNHVVHTLVSVAIIMELLIARPKHPRRRTGMAVMALATGGYLVWIHVIFYHTNQWVYPLLAVLSDAARCAFLGCNVAASLVLYIIGEKLNSCVTGIFSKGGYSKAHGHKSKHARDRPRSRNLRKD